MLNERLARLTENPFARLNELLAPITPRANAPVLAMSVGEPQMQPPPWVAEVIAQNAHLWNRYPHWTGTPEFRAAAAGWLKRRYRFPQAWLDQDQHITPVASSREGLFHAALLGVGQRKADPLALMPNPFYQVYYGAAVMAGAEPMYLPSSGAPDFALHFEKLDAATLARTALMYICTPSNPDGMIMTRDQLKTAITLARRHDFLLVVDECYAEVYSGDAPPVGMIEVLGELERERFLDNVLILHSLSKRSNAAGLRSGFALANVETIVALNRLKSFSSPITPLPILAASAALWDDDAHAQEIRATHRARVDLAERLFQGRFGFYRPPGGFFLWLDVGDGEEAAKRLWRDAAIRVVPGRYLTRPNADGSNSGAPFIRVALVHDLATTEAGLTRIVQTLESWDREKRHG